MITNPEAVAWTIAAEGSISLLRTNHGRGIAAIVNVYNTELVFLEKFRDMVDGVGAIYTRGARKQGNKRCYEWSASSFGVCLDLLLDVYSYLPIKQEQAEIVINFCIRAIEQKRHIPTGRYRPKPTQEDWDALDQVQLLNRKGGD